VLEVAQTTIVHWG